MLAGCTATTIDTQSLQPVGGSELSAASFGLTDQAGTPTLDDEIAVEQPTAQSVAVNTAPVPDTTTDQAAPAALVATQNTQVSPDFAPQVNAAPGTQPLAGSTDDAATQRILQASNAPAGTQGDINPISGQNASTDGFADTEVALAQAPAPAPISPVPVPQATIATAAAPVAAASAFGAAPAAAEPAQRRTGIFRAMFNRERISPPAPVKPAGVSVASAQAATKSQTSDQRVITTVSARSASLPGVNRDRALGVQPSSTDNGARVELASAAGLARLAPNGLKTQHSGVDIQCLKPALVRILKQVEGHYGKPAVVTSGYRSPARNKKARGAKNSLHIYCAAADIQVAGVSKWELASYLRSMPGRGGVGTYCHTQSVHIDIGPTRDWNARCRRR